MVGPQLLQMKHVAPELAAQHFAQDFAPNFARHFAQLLCSLQCFLHLRCVLSRSEYPEHPCKCADPSAWLQEIQRRAEKSNEGGADMSGGKR